MKKILSIEVVKQRIFDKHGDFVKIVDQTYTGVKNRAVFIDSDYGQWETYVSNVLVGHGHKDRSAEKTAKTCMKLYGSSTPLGDTVIRKKIEDTCLKRYGTKNVMGAKCVQDAVKLTMIKKYGHDNAQKVPEIRKRTLETMNERYGCKHPYQSEEIMERMRNKNITNFGVDNPMKSSIVREKSKATCMQRYGVENPAQDPEIHRRIQSSMGKATFKKHWKTGENLSCRCSYEPAVIDWLNKNKIDFDWQVPFRIPSAASPECIAGKTYFIDFLVKSENSIIPVGTYVEIKGYWIQQLSKHKWEWFHETYPNSELWTGSVLKRLGII